MCNIKLTIISNFTSAKRRLVSGHNKNSSSSKSYAVHTDMYPNHTSSLGGPPYLCVDMKGVIYNLCLCWKSTDLENVFLCVIRFAWLKLTSSPICILCLEIVYIFYIPLHSAAQPILYWCSRNMSFWSSISFNLAVLMNLLVAFFYPLEGVRGGETLMHICVHM